jgi:ubiquinone biosynthesis protein
VIASLFRSVRLAYAGFVLAREGVFADVDPALAPPSVKLPLAFAKMIARKAAADPGASRLAIAIGRLGPSYVKLGQFLSTRPDVVGPHVVRDLASLQDRMPAFAKSVAVATVERALGAPIATVFAEFGDAVAAASIAQVHRAIVRDDLGARAVAVKILRPGVEGLFRRDLDDMYFAARFMERHFAEARRLRLIEVVDTLARSVRMEMDFRLEAAAASEYGENVRDDLDFRVPTVDWERTAKEVMTLEWIDGTPLSDLEALRKRGLDLPTLGRVLIQSFLRQAVRDGLFHADMHQGNLFVDETGRLAAVDFGIMGRLGPKERRFLADILYGFITRDYLRVAQVHFEAGYVPEHHRVEDFAQAVRAIGEPIHARTADQISMAKVLTLLFEITALFDMRTRTELVLLQKTMVVVEGVARRLDSKLDIWSASDPVVRDWIAEKVGPIGKIQDAGRWLDQLRRFATDLPSVLVRAERLAEKLEDMADNGFPVATDTVREVKRAEALNAIWRDLGLWAIAIAVACLAIFGR